jgi:hypothetical protein
MKNINIIYFFILALVMTVTYACKKNIELSSNEELEAQTKSSTYLKLADFAALKTLLYDVGRMTDTEYVVWKNEQSLQTLYDRYIQVEKELLAKGTPYRITSKDSVFFLVKNNHLDSKNGILIDKVLNQNALIQIGNEVYRLVDHVLLPESDSFSKELSIMSSEKATGVEPIQQVEYVNYINPDIQGKGLRRSFVDSYTKKIQLSKNEATPEVLEIQYTFYIQPNIERK